MSNALAPRAIALTLALVALATLGFIAGNALQKDIVPVVYQQSVPDPVLEVLPDQAKSAEPSSQEQQEKKIVIVIDDVGYSLTSLELFLKVDMPLSFAVLPEVNHTVESARLIRKAGQDLLLHQPMEALGNENEGPGLIQISMESSQISEQLGRNIASLEGLSGANNHMGSKGTQEEAVLRPLMKTLKENNLYFLDSRTSVDTKARQIAEDMGVLIVERDVFLDNERDEASIRKALHDGLAIADNKGYAIMIGHIWSDDLAKVLIEEYQPLLDKGYSFDTIANFVLGLKAQREKK